MSSRVPRRGFGELFAAEGEDTGFEVGMRRMRHSIWAMFARGTFFVGGRPVAGLDAGEVGFVFGQVVGR